MRLGCVFEVKLIICCGLLILCIVIVCFFFFNFRVIFWLRLLCLFVKKRMLSFLFSFGCVKMGIGCSCNWDLNCFEIGERNCGLRKFFSIVILDIFIVN